MSLFYAKSTGGFYDTAIHGDVMPSDAVAITQATHDAMMAAQLGGKAIVGDSAGHPIAADRAGPTQAEVDAATKGRLAAIDVSSVRALREWLAAQSSAPQFIKDHEAAAVAERAKL